MANTNLHKSKKVKDDEFYTEMVDIKAELKHYDKHFIGKRIYCNCDSHNSNFVKYFKTHFDRLQLKALDFTYFDKDAGKGDFRSDDSVELLKRADVVITNPPFSLFRPFINLLMEHNKKFLVIGNINSISYKECFELIKLDKMWLGYNDVRNFERPDGSISESARSFWFTNLENNKINKELILTKKYNPSDYPKYDNFDGINVDKTKNIPIDFTGYMGVPITFISKYNKNQFEIIKFRKGDDGKDLRINGKVKYARILIKRITP